MPGLSKSFGSIAGAHTAQPFVFNDTLSVDDNDYNLYQKAVAAGWDEVTVLEATLTIEAGVIVGSTGFNALIDRTSSAFPEGSTWLITNRGKVQGPGGDGGDVSCSFGSALNGVNGGSGLRIDEPTSRLLVTVDNAGAEIAGGGGGGGGDIGGGDGATGGGGAGVSGGSSPSSDGSCSTTYLGSDGTETSGGAGGSGGSVSAGAGGDPGQAGSPGGGTSGGAAGNSVAGYSKITWIDEGTLTGPTTG